MRVKSSLTGRARGKELEMRISENKTLSLMVDKEVSKKFVSGVSGKMTSKSSFGKQKFGAKYSRSIARTEQLRESIVSVNRRPWCSGCNRYHTRRCLGNANVCYNCVEVVHYKRNCL